MQVKVVTIDVRLSDNTKRAIRWLVLPVAILAGSVAVAHAFDTNWIQSGASVSAASLKADLDEIKTQLDNKVIGDSENAQTTKFIVKAGTASGATPFTVSFPTSFPHGLAGVVASCDGITQALQVYDTNTGGFTVGRGAGASFNVNWIAVGW
jgi:hypothetical protein